MVTGPRKRGRPGIRPRGQRLCLDESYGRVVHVCYMMGLSIYTHCLRTEFFNWCVHACTSMYIYITLC